MKFNELFASNRIRLLLIAVVLAIFATMLVDAYLRKEIYVETGGMKVNIIFVKSPIKQNDFIKPENLAIGEFPSLFLDNRFIPGDQINNLPGLRVVNELKPGQILMWTDIAFNVARSLSDHINLNDRVITLPVNITNSFNNMVEPGDRIDIMYIQKGSGMNSKPTARVLLQDVFIIAINNNVRREITGSYLPTNIQNQSSSSQSGISTISVRVSAFDALKLAYAESEGRLIFVLRNRFDIFTSDYEPISEDTGNIIESIGDFGVDRFGLPTKVKDYPVIYNQGQPVHSGYFPGHEQAEADFSQMPPAQFQQRLGNETIGSSISSGYDPNGNVSSVSPASTSSTTDGK